MIGSRAVLAIATYLLLFPDFAHAGLCDLLEFASPEESASLRDPVYLVNNEAWRDSPSAEKYIDVVFEDEVAADSEDPESSGLTPDEVAARLDRLMRQVRSSSAFQDDRDNGVLLRRALLAQLEFVKKNVPSAQPNEAIEWKSADQFVNKQWTNEMKEETCDDRLYHADIFYFDREEPRTPLALVIARLDDEGEDAEAFFYIADKGQSTEVRAVVAEVNRLFHEFRRAPIARTIKRLDKIDGAWTNYLTKGYSQYPWETYVNSFRTLVDYSWAKPPGHQWIVLHPEAVMVVDARSTQDASLKPGLLVHGLGWINYVGDENKWFWGVSATGSITSSSNRGLGGGGTLHFGHTAIHNRVPHISLSVLWHDTRSGRSAPFIGLSLDLWRLLDETSNEPRFREVLEKANSVVN